MWSWGLLLTLEVLTGVTGVVSVYCCREVTKARDKTTGKLVALKKIRMENEKDGVCESTQGRGHASAGTYCPTTCQ